VGRPTMRFVPIKSIVQQSILALHRVRALLVRQRTSTVNAMRGLLSQFGIVAGKGIRRVDELRQRMGRTECALLPDEAREAIGFCLTTWIAYRSESIKSMPGYWPGAWSRSPFQRFRSLRLCSGSGTDNFCRSHGSATRTTGQLLAQSSPAWSQSRRQLP